MRTGKRNLIFTFLLFLTAGLCISSAQDMPIGGWHVHLPYKNCHYVTGSASSIWAGTDNGLFRLNRADNAVERITKIEGLSDLSLGAINYNEYNSTLVVGYKNGNLDLIRNNTIVNLPDIKRAQVVGSKAINNIYFVNQLAYLSTGFGIVVIDTDRNEVKETYFIGNNGANVEVNDVTSDGTTLFAATESGIYYAPINDPFITNFATWNRFNNLPNGVSFATFTNADFFSGKLIVTYEPTYPVYSYNAGIVFTYDASQSNWDTLANNVNAFDLFVRNNVLYFSDNYQIHIIDPSFVQVGSYNDLSTASGMYLQPRQVFVDETSTPWEADRRFGLVKCLGQQSGLSFYPNGPSSTSAYWMARSDDELLVVTGGHDDAWNNVLNTEGFSVYRDNSWSIYEKTAFPGFDTLYDFISCAVDPKNAGHYFLGSWGEGLLEINNGQIAHLWDNSNSTLASKIEYQWVGIGGMAYDTTGNLWVVNSHAVSAINVYKPNGTWQAFDFTGLIPVGLTASEIIITQSGQKWVILPRGSGILVFDDNGTLSNTSDDKKKKLGFTSGIGAIPGTEVYCLAEDRDGEIWVGTDKGVGVFYCAENIFSSAGCDAQQILIEQDGHTQILLETQVVTCIAVDGANRKWIGTESGGVFLMSADGTEQLAHFDASNSPLLSDNITSIIIDQQSGEIFFGTSKGIVSYRGEAIEGLDEMGDVYAFPNPVRPEYSGPIAITGLVRDADVKITDVSGNVVFKTKALGGQAIWDGNNFKGERAASGVYLVMISNEDGSQTAITKILLMN